MPFKDEQASNPLPSCWMLSVPHHHGCCRQAELPSKGELGITLLKSPLRGRCGSLMGFEAKGDEPGAGAETTLSEGGSAGAVQISTASARGVCPCTRMATRLGLASPG